MLKKLKGLMKNQKYRTGMIIGAVSVLITAAMIFIGFELRHNQSLFINNFIKQQQTLTDQVAIRLQYYMNTDAADTSKAIDKIISEVDTSGSSYWFIAEGEKLLFVKNRSTSGLFTYISLEAFMQDNKKDGMKITTSSFSAGDKQYTLGRCTTTDYIMEAGQTFKHNIYVIMPLILITCVMMVIFILGLLTINKQENKIAQLSAEAVDRNITIEQLTARIKKIRLNDLGTAKSQNTDNKDKIIYSKEVLASLLNKISRENIVPLTILIIELTSKNKDIPAEDYQQFIKSASKHLNKEHVLAEILPGIYTILIFHTVSDSIDEIKHTLVHEWAFPLKKKGVKVRMGISCIEDYDSKAENVFDIVYREVSGMYQEAPVKLSS